MGGGHIGVTNGAVVSVWVSLGPPSIDVYFLASIDDSTTCISIKIGSFRYFNPFN